MNPVIGVVGASVRAAVHSLARAGFEAWAVDLFGDRDLKQLAPTATCPLDDFPAALSTLAARFPPGPVLYTGAVENHPRVVAELAAARPLWGNPSDVLERIRNPHLVRESLGNRHPTPELVPPHCAAPNTGRWLRKPLHSSSGQGIRFATPGEPPSTRHYFQEFIDGLAMSAIFVSTLDEGDGFEQAQLLGITEQLIGEPWLHARPFAYCGNVGPILLPRAVETALRSVAVLLSHAVGLRGSWGMDFILRENAAYLVEVNPRYTAGVEVLELGARFRSLMLHCDCFTNQGVLAKVKQPRSYATYATPVGKAIYYAPHRIVFPTSGPWDDDLTCSFDPWRVPGFADVPETGSVIEAGCPVLTFFAQGSSVSECRNGLQSRAAELDHLFAESIR